MSDKLREPWKFENPVCREIGGDIFYSGDEDDPEQIDSNLINNNLAKKVCEGCSHLMECRNWALRHESHGVWGGLTPKELANLRSRKKIPLRSLTSFKFL